MKNTKKNIGLILASGTGSRCELEYPKQFAKVNDKTILELSIDEFENHPNINEIILVTNSEYVNKVKDIVKKTKYKKVSRVIAGGVTRKDSSYNGISSIVETNANVLIHDAVRPLVTREIITNCIESLNTYKAVCVAINSTDTIFIINEENNIVSIPKRKLLKRAQTPQCFDINIIKEAHRLANLDKSCMVTDDCGLIMNYNLSPIHIVDGSIDNIKVTFKDDIEFVKSKILEIKK